jgi:hypothetical protein
LLRKGGRRQFFGVVELLSLWEDGASYRFYEQGRNACTHDDATETGFAIQGQVQKGQGSASAGALPFCLAAPVLGGH